MTLARLVDDWNYAIRLDGKVGRQSRDDEEAYYSAMTSFAKAVEHAATAQVPSQMQPLILIKSWHQQRISTPTLIAGWHALVSVLMRRNYGNSVSFAELHDAAGAAAFIVNQRRHVLSEKGIGLGELWMYDTAMRLGIFFQQLPLDVPLHAHVRKGAKALRLRVNRRSIPIVHFHPEIQALGALQIESFLCVLAENLPAYADEHSAWSQLQPFN